SATWDKKLKQRLSQLDSLADNETETQVGYDSGCTAVVALVRGRTLVVANAGDSRCVVCRSGKAVDMSLDHKPEDATELSRICRAGGRVTRDGRVNGGLNLSRAIGDHAYKRNTELELRDQMITALPDIKTLELDPETDEFMILACDGIWYVLNASRASAPGAENIIPGKLADYIRGLSVFLSVTVFSR
ncbi:unnamed protein product, partial [Ixodes pacificus]